VRLPEVLVVEAVMLWNEPNNLSHWDFEADPDWSRFADLVHGAAAAIHAVRPRLPIVLGGISPIDPAFVQRMRGHGVLDVVDAVAVHGFPLDWNHWQVHEWPDKLQEIAEVTTLPVWVSEAGVSSFGAEEVQDFGLRRSVELLRHRTPRLHWYSLLDLPRTWPATTRHRKAEGSSYYRHFYMGLIREDGSPKVAAGRFSEYTPGVGICQWFHFEDPRLATAVDWLERLGVTYLRTGLSWADRDRPNALSWFDQQMQALDHFAITLTFCFTPELEGLRPHYTSPPRHPDLFAAFCREMVERYTTDIPVASAVSLAQGQQPSPAGKASDHAQWSPTRVAAPPTIIV